MHCGGHADDGCRFDSYNQVMTGIGEEFAAELRIDRMIEHAGSDLIELRYICN
jgi:hypothetical protein